MWQWLDDKWTELQETYYDLKWKIPRFRGWRHDRTGRRLWVFHDVKRDNKGEIHVWIPLYPGPSAFIRPSGWISMAEHRPGDWTICDIRVSHEGRGVGSLLLQEAISVARAHDASILRGFVIREDYEQAPFLLDWYSRYGFEVHSNLVTDHDNDTVAIFRMVL